MILMSLENFNIRAYLVELQSGRLFYMGYGSLYVICGGSPCSVKIDVKYETPLFRKDRRKI